jgi:hypothetical protein
VRPVREVAGAVRCAALALLARVRDDAVRREWEHGRNLVVFEVEHVWVGEGVAWWEGERPGAAVLTGLKPHRGKTIRLLRGAIRIREFYAGWDPRGEGGRW